MLLAPEGPILASQLLNKLRREAVAYQLQMSLSALCVHVAPNCISWRFVTDAGWRGHISFWMSCTIQGHCMPWTVRKPTSTGVLAKLEALQQGLAVRASELKSLQVCILLASDALACAHQQILLKPCFM